MTASSASARNPFYQEISAALSSGEFPYDSALSAATSMTEAAALLLRDAGVSKRVVARHFIARAEKLIQECDDIH